MEETRDLSGFDSIRLNSTADVFVTKGSRYKLVVEADADVIDRIKTTVTGGTLTIDMESSGRWTWGDSNAKVYVTMPGLDAVTLNGSGDIDVGAFSGSSLDLDLKGSGDIDIDAIDYKTVSVDLKGSGDIEARGTCTDLTVKIKGSGDVDMDRLECTSAAVMIRGSGDVSVYAGDSFDGSISGSGDIEVHGSPRKNSSSVRGSGDIILRSSK